MRNKTLLWAVVRSGKLHREIAAAIGVNESALSRWISGESNPNMANMQRLLRVLGYTKPEELGYRYVSTYQSKTTRHYEVM